MKTLKIMIALILISVSYSFGQNITLIQTYSTDYSYQLDLQAVASAFAESGNLEEFERKLNDPYLQISNLDLNNDGFVDYLRVLETSVGYTHLITVQAVLGRNYFQDVASIDLEKGIRGETRVQIIGNTYIYGPNYIFNPVYVRPPVIFSFFWGNYYRPWNSPYYYGYYPSYYQSWHACHVFDYQHHLKQRINHNIAYYPTNKRMSKKTAELQRKHSRSDFETRNPNTTFAQRSRNGDLRSEAQSSTRRTPTSSYSNKKRSETQAGSSRNQQAKQTSSSQRINSQAASSTRAVKQSRNESSASTRKIANTTPMSRTKTDNSSTSRKAAQSSSTSRRR